MVLRVIKVQLPSSIYKIDHTEPCEHPPLPHSLTMAPHYLPADPPNPSTSLLTKPHKPPSSFLFTSLVAITLVSLTTASAFAFLFFASPSTSYLRDGIAVSHSSKPVARPLKKLARPTVILISSDGFKYGYQFKVPTPNIHRLIREGTEAHLGLIPVYPSITIPNHYSMATGLYPVWSGVVDYHFFDPATNITFSASNHDPRLWLGEPIWETATKQGYPAAALYWAGSEVKKGSWTCPPKFCPKYTSKASMVESIDTILSYMDLPSAEIPVITALYITEPDMQGHKWGPDHPEINEGITHVDNALGRLIAGLEERGIYEDVNLIFLGDHGMVTTCDKKYIFLEDLAPWIDIPESWMHSRYQTPAVEPPPGVDPAEVLAKMNQALNSGNITNGDKVTFYLKQDFPARFHYFDSDRISSIIGLVAEGYSVVYSRTEGSKCSGVHGYDNLLFSMRSIFVAHGPRFPKGKKIPPFVNIEVYRMITTILGLKEAPNNGTESFTNSVLLPNT